MRISHSIIMCIIAVVCAYTAAEPEQASPTTAPIAAPRPTTLPSGVFNWDELAVQSTSAGEKRQVLQHATATLDQLEVHITTLDPGQQSHPPHRHPHEEMMLLKEGTLEAFVNGKHTPMPTGSILFLAPFDLHNVKNVGTTRATYFVITWRTPMTAPAPRAEQWKPDAGFTSLYNGKDLTRWCYSDDETFDGKTETTDNRFAAKGETLVVIAHDQSQPPRIRKLFTTQKFPKDFVLKLEFRAAVNADSGVYLRAPQLQCRDYLVAGPYKTLKNYKPQDWNTIVVTVTNNIAHCECNGEVLEDALKLPETGPIGLESDRGQMEYRHIEIKEGE